VRGSRIGHARHQVDIHVVAAGQGRAVAVAHDLHIEVLVGGGGVAVIHPQKGANPKLVIGRDQLLDAVGCNLDDLAGSKLFLDEIIQVREGAAFLAGTEGAVLLSEDQGGAAVIIPGRIDPVLGQQQDRAGAVDRFLSVVEPGREGILLVDQGGDQFGGINLATAHL